MENETTVKKLCENCAHFIQHYVNFGLYFGKTFCGHCMHDGNNKKFKNRPTELCDFWESDTRKKEEQKISMFKTIELMSKQLKHIAFLLEEDKKL